MRWFIVALATMLFVAPKAHAENRPTFEFAFGFGDYDRTLTVLSQAPLKSNASLTRIRAELVMPLTGSAWAILGYQRTATDDGLGGYYAAGGQQVTVKDVAGLIEIGFRLAF